MVKQSYLLNKVRLMEAIQEPEEPIRTFVDRLRGLAYVCSLSTECPNQHCTISNVNATLLLAMVKGLVDPDIQGERLAKVEQMDWETTIAFVEIREMDKKAASIARLPFPFPAVDMWQLGQEPEETNSVSVMHGTEGATNSPLSQYMVSGGEFDKLWQLDEESVKTNSVTVIHSTERTTNSHLCHYRVLGKEFGYKQAIQKQLKTSSFRRSLLWRPKSKSVSSSTSQHTNHILRHLR